jgi:hypothetical protein
MFAKYWIHTSLKTAAVGGHPFCNSATECPAHASNHMWFGEFDAGVYLVFGSVLPWDFN